MSLEPRIAFVESLQFFDREISAQSHDYIQADGRVPFRKDKSVSSRPLRILRIDAQSPEKKGNQNVHRRKRTTHVPSSALGDGANRKPAPLPCQSLQFAIIAFHVPPLFTASWIWCYISVSFTARFSFKLRVAAMAILSDSKASTGPGLGGVPLATESKNACNSARKAGPKRSIKKWKWSS